MVSRAHIQLCNVNGRSSLHLDGKVIDVERRSHGSFSSDPMDALTRWEQFCTWAELVNPDPGDVPLDPAQLGPCVPRPPQVFAIGLNYRDHAREAGMEEPKQPMVFTKFQSCLSGARSLVQLTSDTVDWEVELVVVIGLAAHHVREADALNHVAGYCIGQDISDRRAQFIDVPPQFSYGKSATGFGPIGPWVTAREGVDWENLELTCEINETRMQNGKSSDMVFGVPALIAFLSRYCTLMPGDLIFTGTPAGVGSGRKPRQYLQPGDVIRSKITGLGELENTCHLPST